MQVNSNNETIFEDESSYLRVQYPELFASVPSPGTAGDNEMVTEPENTSAAIEKGKNDYGTYRTFWELQTYFSSDPKKLESELGLTYETSTSGAAKPATAASSASNVSSQLAPAAVEHADVFKLKLDRALALFESHPFTTSELAQGLAARKRDRDDAVARQQRANENIAGGNNAVGMGRPPTSPLKYRPCHVDAHDGGDVMAVEDMVNESMEYVGCKYLTSSQLFKLQLHDPQLRLQVLAQIIAFCHHFRLRLLSIMTTMNSNATVAMNAAATAAAGMVSTNKRGGKGALSSASTPSAPAAIPATVAAMNAIIVACDHLHSDLGAFKKRAYNLLSQTPPDGMETVSILKQILRREANWIQWKIDSCPAFERPAADVSVFTSAMAKAVKSEHADMYALKGFAPTAGKSSKGAKSSTAQINSYEFDLSTAKVTQTAHKLVEDVPDFNTHFEFYVQAEDPENGIEAEYHPKHDGVYCWRARRLLAAVKLKEFEKMPDGNLSKIVPRKQLPEHTLPQSQQQESVSQAPLQDGEQQLVQNNCDMDSASSGNDDAAGDDDNVDDENRELAAGQDSEDRKHAVGFAVEEDIVTHRPYAAELMILSKSKSTDDGEIEEGEEVEEEGEVATPSKRPRLG
jgi:hypothetical protein